MTTVSASNGSQTSSATAYGVANQMLTQRGRTFHWARRLLCVRHAERATRLYGFCRHIDDLVDECSSLVAAHSALAVVRQALQTGHSDDPVTRDMLQLMRDCDIDPMIPLELVEGVESDLGEVRVTDMAELLRYCYRVAGTVGLMMTDVFDVSVPEALPHAVDLGIAMQLTNICRDVREDALLGRRYLPATLVGALEPSALIDPDGATQATAVHAIDALLTLADRYYASGEQGLRCLPPGARSGILVAARVYREIGVVLQRRGGDCWTSRATVSTAAKAGITLRALGGTMIPWRREPARTAHNSSLRVAPFGTHSAWPTKADLGD